MRYLLCIFALLVSACSSGIIHQDEYSNIPKCSDVTIKGDVKECVVR